MKTREDEIRETLAMMQQQNPQATREDVIKLQEIYDKAAIAGFSITPQKVLLLTSLFKSPLEIRRKTMLNRIKRLFFRVKDTLYWIRFHNFRKCPECGKWKKIGPFYLGDHEGCLPF